MNTSEVEPVRGTNLPVDSETHFARLRCRSKRF